MSDEDLIGMSREGIVSAVASEFERVATDPFGIHPFPVGRVLTLKNGYPKEILETLPDSLCELFAGAGNPHPFVNIREGEIVLDLGCGAGLDLYFYRRAAGPKGRVYGVDASDAMVKKARSNMMDAGIGWDNVQIVQSNADRLNFFTTGSIDTVACNGIFNLVPSKEAAIREVFRVLKPGGRLVFSEIVMEKPLSARSIREWLKCIGGAIPANDFIALLKKEGFKKINVLSMEQNPRTWHPLAACATLEAYKPK